MTTALELLKGIVFEEDGMPAEPEDFEAALEEEDPMGGDDDMMGDDDDDEDDEKLAA